MGWYAIPFSPCDEPGRARGGYLVSPKTRHFFLLTLKWAKPSQVWLHGVTIRAPTPTLTLLPFPFPWSVVPTEPPDLPCFTSLCRVHAEEGRCLRRWPGASQRPSQAGGEVPLPNGGWWALGWPLAGSFPRRGHITTFRLQVPALSPSFGERNTNPLPSPSCLCCADGGFGMGGGSSVLNGAVSPNNAPRWPQRRPGGHPGPTSQLFSRPMGA